MNTFMSPTFLFQNPVRFFIISTDLAVLSNSLSSAVIPQDLFNHLPVVFFIVRPLKFEFTSLYGSVKHVIFLVITSKVHHEIDKIQNALVFFVGFCYSMDYLYVLQRPIFVPYHDSEMFSLELFELWYTVRISKGLRETYRLGP